jgi:hypothetical protein
MANVKISDLTAAASVADANEFEINEAGTSKKVTGAQISTKVRGDITSTDVQTAGALMDSELTDITAVKAINQGVATTDSPQFSKIQLGHASDTTIRRSGPGVIMVEGVEVTTNTATQTLTNKTLTSPVINVTSDATGDIYYRNAGLLSRLPIGSTNDVLTVASGLPSWAAPASSGQAAWTLIGVTEPISDVSSISFTGLSSYDEWRLWGVFKTYAASSGKIYIRDTGGTWRQVGATPTSTTGGGKGSPARPVIAFEATIQNVLNSYSFDTETVICSGSAANFTVSTFDRSSSNTSSIQSSNVLFGYSTYAGTTYDEIKIDASFEGSNANERAIIVCEAR